jgi:hypothetical protein
MENIHPYISFPREFSLGEAEKFLDRIAFELRVRITYDLSLHREIRGEQGEVKLQLSNHEIFGCIESGSNSIYFSLHRSEKGEGFIGIGFGIDGTENRKSLVERINVFLEEYKEQIQKIEKRL